MSNLIIKIFYRKIVKDILFFLKVNDLVACGGYGFNKTKIKPVLSRGLVHRKHYNNGCGTNLFRYRLNQIKKCYSNIEICLDTDQHIYSFFEKFDFKIIKISKNGCIKGLDRYYVVLK